VTENARVSILGIWSHPTPPSPNPYIDEMIQAEGLPDNPTVFEKNLAAFKKTPEKLFDFLKKIKSDYL